MQRAISTEFGIFAEKDLHRGIVKDQEKEEDVMVATIVKVQAATIAIIASVPAVEIVHLQAVLEQVAITTAKGELIKTNVQ